MALNRHRSMSAVPSLWGAKPTFGMFYEKLPRLSNSASDELEVQVNVQRVKDGSIVCAA
jgi:hypothetical protein